MQSFLKGFQRDALWWTQTIAATILSGCTTAGPNYTRPDLKALEQFYSCRSTRLGGMSHHLDGQILFCGIYLRNTIYPTFPPG